MMITANKFAIAESKDTAFIYLADVNKKKYVVRRRMQENSFGEAQVGLLKQAQGSCQYRLGASMVLCAVYGPSKRLVSKNTELLDISCKVRIFWRSLDGEADAGRQQYFQEKMHGLLMGKRTSTTSSGGEELAPDLTRTAVLMDHLFPRSGLVLSFQVLDEEDSSLILACAINAMSLALLNAGLPLKFTFFAFACCLVDDDKEVQLGRANSSVVTITLENTTLSRKDFFLDVHHHTEDHEGSSSFLPKLPKLLHACHQQAPILLEYFRNLLVGA